MRLDRLSVRSCNLQEPILDAQGELTEARPASPSSVSNGSGEQITSYSSVSPHSQTWVTHCPIVRSPWPY